MRYLFVFGCPRSGTTVLGRLLASHPAVVLGIERFGRVNSLDPQLFEIERFFDIRESDTHYSSFDFKEYQLGEDILRERYVSAKWVGDKLPRLYRKLDGLKRFPKEDVMLVFAVRNVWDVCLSYHRRFMNPADSWNYTASDGVTEWNASLRGVMEAQKLGYSLMVVDYDEMFAPSQTTENLLGRIGELMATLGLAPTEEVAAQVSKEISKLSQLDRRRNNDALPLDAKKKISLNAAFGLYRSLLRELG